MKYVIDASVEIKTFVTESDSSKAVPENKRLPCRRWDLAILRTFHGTVERRFFKGNVQGKPKKCAERVLSGWIAVSPNWYIRGVTPRCRIRRWRTERAPGFEKGFAPWCQ
jgi:hypothetical protein